VDWPRYAGTDLPPWMQNFGGFYQYKYY
jgi:hypothetical protein